MHKRVLAVGIALVMISLAVRSPGWAAPLPQGQAIVTYPADGATISGVVQITGVAAHPNILWYDVSYASGPEATAGTQWISLARVENTRVENGVLATWDTTSLPNGQYCLALTMMGRDDSFVYQKIVTRLTVNSAQPAVAPTAAQPTPLPLPMPTALIGPTATPITVEQPPTATPRASSAAGEEGGGEAAPTADGGSSLALDTGALRGAFCTGSLIVSMLFVLLGLYQLTKAIIRWHLRGRRLPRE
jgi:hypothetical protein